MVYFKHNEEQKAILKETLKRARLSVSAFSPWGMTSGNAHKGHSTLLAPITIIQGSGEPYEIEPPAMEDVEMLFYAQDSHDLAIFTEIKDILEDNVLPNSRGFINNNC